MPELTHAANYFTFLTWFKNKYPRLYKPYSLTIPVPTDTIAIKAAMDYVDAIDRQALQAVIDEYNNTSMD